MVSAAGQAAVQARSGLTNDARDYNAEYKDGGAKYAYEFDTSLRRYMMRTLDPFLPPGRALEMGCYTGDVTEMIAERYADLTVIEASDELVAAPRSTRLGRARAFSSTARSRPSTLAERSTPSF